MKPDSQFIEKVSMLVLAGICIIALTWIAVKALKAGSVDANASALVGVIVAGLSAAVTGIIQAIRGYQMSAQLGKVTDQLADSRPATEAETGAPKKVEVVNTKAKPVPTTKEGIP